MKLIENDWLAINNLLLKMYSQDSKTLFENSLMQNLKVILPYDKASLFLHNHEKGSGLCRPCGIGFADGTLEKKVHMVNHEIPHSWISFYERSLVVRDSDVCNGEEYSNSLYYTDLLLTENVKYGLTIALAYKQIKIGVLTLFREKGKKDFSDKEIQIAEQIMEHIASYSYKIYGLERYNKATQVTSIIELSHTYDLSARETEVFRLLLEGKSTRSICEELHVAETTAKKHLSSIYSKMKIKNKAELFKILTSDVLTK